MDSAVAYTAPLILTHFDLPRAMNANRAALYLRSSEDRSYVSLDAQRRELTALAASKNLVVAAEYSDAVESANDVTCPGFRDLLVALREPVRNWSTLFVVDTSRLARNVYLAESFKHECRKRSVKVIFSKLPEVNTMVDLVVIQVLQAFDQLHSMMSREKGLAGMAENVRQGYRAGGRAPYGYELKTVATGAVREGAPVEKRANWSQECTQLQSVTICAVARRASPANH